MPGLEAPPSTITTTALAAPLPPPPPPMPPTVDLSAVSYSQLNTPASTDTYQPSPSSTAIAFAAVPAPPAPEMVSVSTETPRRIPVETTDFPVPPKAAFPYTEPAPAAKQPSLDDRISQLVTQPVPPPIIAPPSVLQAPTVTPAVEAVPSAPLTVSLESGPGLERLRSLVERIRGQEERLKQERGIDLSDTISERMGRLQKSVGRLARLLGEVLQRPDVQQGVSDRVAGIESILARTEFAGGMTARHKRISNMMDVIGGKLVRQYPQTGSVEAASAAVPISEGKESPTNLENKEAAARAVTPDDLRAALRELKNPEIVREYQGVLTMLREAGLPDDVVREQAKRQFGERADAVLDCLRYSQLGPFVEKISRSGLAPDLKDKAIAAMYEKTVAEAAVKPQAEATVEAREDGNAVDSEDELEDVEGTNGKEGVASEEAPPGARVKTGTKLAAEAGTTEKKNKPESREQPLEIKSECQVRGVRPDMQARAYTGEWLRLQHLEETNQPPESEAPNYGEGLSARFGYDGKTGDKNAVPAALPVIYDQIAIANTLGNTVGAVGGQLKATEKLLRALMGERLRTFDRGMGPDGQPIERLDDNVLMTVRHKGGGVEIGFKHRDPNDVRIGEARPNQLNSQVTFV